MLTVTTTHIKQNWHRRNGVPQSDRTTMIDRFIRAGDILTMYMGPHDLLVNLGVFFKPGTTAERMHESIHRIEKDLAAAYPECTRVYIETEWLTGLQGADQSPAGRRAPAAG